MKNYIYSALCCLLLIWTSCSDMNDMHEKYMINGETTYVGKVDSLKTFSGRERVLIRYWVTDPRVKSLTIYWNQKADSLITEVPAHQPSDSLEVMIGENGSTIAEGEYTFFFYSHDNKGHRSVKYETLINIYGDRFQHSLSNRLAKKATPDALNHKLSITWGGSSSTNEIGIEVAYVKVDGTAASLLIGVADLAKGTVIQDVDLTREVSYQTLFKPAPEALDTFKAPKVILTF